MRTSFSMLCLAFALTCGCGDDGSSVDGGVDASTPDAGNPVDSGAPSDASTDAGPDATTPTDAGSSCLDEGRAAGDRFPADDGCNSCECNADGSRDCTERTCPPSRNGCTYDGAMHEYAERFPSTDGCNECVCAASGLACTRRECKGASEEEGAILVDSLDEPCGADTTFTARSVLDGLPHEEITAPFVYDHTRPAILYPETLPDTTVTMRITYDDGFAVCRIPSKGQEAFDIEVLLEWTTADGSFDEGFHTYLRRNATGFVDSWFTQGTREVGELSGTYEPNCLDPDGFSFAAELAADGTAGGAVHKTCETDLALVVGSWTLTP